MAGNLKTGWLTIGRSGPTVDGRNISDQMILEAAETYDANLYGALIWPEHYRYANFGRVEQVRAVKNSEGGYDLQAILAPNDFYQNSNAYGQKLYTSMEITENFRNTKKFYLTGLGATDSPASAATSLVKFSQEGGDAFRAQPQEIVIQSKPEKRSLYGWLRGEYQEDEEMSKEVLKVLAEEIKALRQDFTALKKPADDKPADPPKPATDPNADKFAALEQRFAAMEQKIDALKPADPPKPATDPNADKFTALEQRFTALEQKLTEALNTEHPNGTKPPASSGAAASTKAFM